MRREVALRAALSWRAFPPVAALLLVACAGPSPDADRGSIRSLHDVSQAMPADPGIPEDRDAALQAYRAYLQKAPAENRSAQALRRLGDLEMEHADAAAGADTQKGVAPYAHAVRQYEEMLNQYPHAPDNDQVLYQLAHAQEMAGNLEAGLAALNRLIKEFPGSAYVDEANFRRGELMFTLKNYRGAESAYARIVGSPRHTPYFERSLYMTGWSRYKQGRLDDALESFLSVLDLKLIARSETQSIQTMSDVTAGERELIDDTLRVTAICLASLQGPESIASHVQSALRHDYEYRLYQALGGLYQTQQRVKDAADTYLDFVHRYPLHPQSPGLLARVVDIYQQAGFEALVWDVKRQFVDAYGAGSPFAQQRADLWQGEIRDHARSYLVEIAKRDHALSQQNADAGSRHRAIDAYQRLLQGYPGDADAAQVNFLLAELLFEDHRFGEAATEYEKTAYQYLPHPRSADSGYAALLAYAAQEPGLSSPAQRLQLTQSQVESAVRFADTFASDPRVPDVLVDAARKAFAAHDADRSADLARRLLAQPDLPDGSRRILAWNILAQGAFESGAFDDAEKAYLEVRSRLRPDDPRRHEVDERLAVSVYKQGEAAQKAGDLAGAARTYLRVGEVSPASPVRANAQFDAANAQIQLHDWSAAAATLEDFRARFADHALAPQVDLKLAAVYAEAQRWPEAAKEYEHLSMRGDPALAAQAQWQAAELFEKGGQTASARHAYTEYVQRFPAPFEQAIEARVRLVKLARANGSPDDLLAARRALIDAEKGGGEARTAHTRLVAATEALALAEPDETAYRQVALVEPLKAQLKLKKARLESALATLAQASEFGVAEITTEATYRSAALYQDFAKAMLASERPAGLNKDELEQYDVLLEEQSFPFEEKAGRLFETDARHTLDGLYDDWVRRSYIALARWRPVRFDKPELSEDVIDAVR